MPRGRGSHTSVVASECQAVMDPDFAKFKAQGEALELKGTELIAYIEKQQSIEREREREEKAATEKAAEREERIAAREHEERIRQSELDFEGEQRRLDREHDLEVKRIQSQTNQQIVHHQESGPKVKMPFLEDKENIESYLAQFERVAIVNKWDDNEWGTRLAPLLKGDAREVYIQIPLEDSADYQVIKKALLKRNELNAVTYRKRFRGARPKDGEQNYVYWDRLDLMLKRWIEMSGKEEEDLKEMLLFEKFLETQSMEKARFIREREPANKNELVRIADLFDESRMAEKRIVNGRLHDNRSAQRGNQQQERQNQQGLNREQQSVSTNAQQGSSSNQSQTTKHGGVSYRGPPTFQRRNEVRGCFGCGGPHRIRDCPDKPKERVSVIIGDEIEENHMMFTQTQDSRNSSYYCTVKVEGKQARGMRDTGATQTQVRKDLVPARCYTGRRKTVRYANNFKDTLPTAVVNLETPYYIGEIEVLVADDAPVPVLIGNMREEEKLRITQEKRVSTEVIPTETAIDPKREEQSKSSETIVAPVVQSEPGEEGTSRESDQVVQNPPALKVKQTALANVTPCQLREEQGKDPSLRVARQQATSGDAVTIRRNGVRSSYYYKRRILYRKYEDNVRTINQVVVPKPFRAAIMELAHDPPMSAHMGVGKTKERVISAFYWPGIDGDVRRHCLSCDACQRCAGKGRIRKAPLQAVPVIARPFKQVAVDIVGPINPVSSKGNRYVLTMIDYTTKYAEAAALPTIDTTTVAEALLEMWSRLGIPERMVSDRGTQFTSNLMREILHLLSIKGITTTPYHAQANGLVEKFNCTLKNMIQRLCIEQPSEWDRWLPAMLFAYREVPQDSTLFSPFELLYGRTVRGPLEIIKRVWTQEQNDEEIATTAEYVTNLRNRIEQTCKIAAENQKVAKERYKKAFDRKAKERKLEVGDKVLVLLPDKHKRLQLSWKGPFEITKRINAVDYSVRIKGKEKTYHINLVKKYHERESEEAIISVVVHEEEEDMNVQVFRDEIPLIPLKQTEDFQNVMIATTLKRSEEKDLKAIVRKHQKVFSDLPGTTTLTECQLKLTTQEPVRVPQYPLPHSQIKIVKEEVTQMEKMGVIKKTNSPYNAPIVLVKKKDGSVRFCTDYRRLNLVTEFDAEPMPSADEIFAKLGKNRYFSKLDLCKGFWQLPVKEEDQIKTAFNTPQGQYCWTRMPFGLKNASAVFSRMMRKLLLPLHCDDVHNFIDDILIGSDTWEKHVCSLDAVLERLEMEGLTAKPSKCHLGYEELSFLGHEIGHGLIKPEQGKIQKLQEAQKPETKKQVRAFLGLAGYYRKFIPNFAEIARPLTDATKKGNPDTIHWTADCERAFSTLKAKLTGEPVLIIPDMKKEFVLRTDASEKGLGAVLLQDKDGDLRPIAYASKKLINAELNYSTIEKECLGIIWAIRKFEPFLYGVHFVLQTDHRPLEYLKRSKTDNGRLMRWALQLQQHSFALKVIPGIDNVGADYMSRIQA